MLYPVLEKLTLHYLPLEELIGYCHLTEEQLAKVSLAKQFSNFTGAFDTVVLETLRALTHNNIPLVDHPGDKKYIVLARTIQALETEKENLLHCTNLTKTQIDALTASTLNSVEDLLQLNQLLDEINMALALPMLPKKKTRVEEISLNAFSLTRLAPQLIAELKTYPDLRKLYLSNNQLTTLPASFDNLTALEELWLNDNHLTTLPASLSKLTALTLLDLSKNQFTTLPASLGNLTALEELWLTQNQLTTLPEFLGNLTTLKTLALSYNQLTILPEFLGNLTALEILYLSYNSLTTLPTSLGNLTSLKKLWLHGNQLTTISKTVRQLLIKTDNSTYLNLISPTALTNSSSSSASSSNSLASEPMTHALNLKKSKRKMLENESQNTVEGTDSTRKKQKKIIIK